jgi:putative lipase involved disintegration of autophagic bodies
MLNAVKALYAAHSNAAVVVTGHSLGAAQATFALIDIKKTVNP